METSQPSSLSDQPARPRHREPLIVAINGNRAATQGGPDTGTGGTDTGSTQAGSRTGGTAEVAAAGSRGQQIVLRRCGPGCFAGPAGWAPGLNRLRVTATADGWNGGTAVPAFTLHEAVTSDTSRPTPVIQTLPLTGARFLASEPHTNETGQDSTVLSSSRDSTKIAFDLVAEGFYFELTVGPGHRICAETLTSPGHLITRTFDYPGAGRR